jgi:hypothetical protein
MTSDECLHCGSELIGVVSKARQHEVVAGIAGTERQWRQSGIALGEAFGGRHPQAGPTETADRSEALSAGRVQDKNVEALGLSIL